MENRTPFVGRVYRLVCSCDPTHVRYIGETILLIERRLKGHLDEARLSADHTPKLAWIRKHTNLGHEIRTELVTDEAESAEELSFFEIGYMWAYSKWGHRLTNSSTKAMLLQPASLETRRKIGLRSKQQRFSEETRAKMSASHKAYANTPEGHAAKIRGGLGGRKVWETPEGAASRRRGAAKGNVIGRHIRWHVNKNIFDPDCGLCQAIPEADRVGLAIKQPKPAPNCTKEDRIVYRNHVYWHTNRGIFNPDCKFCQLIPEADRAALVVKRSSPRKTKLA